MLWPSEVLPTPGGPTKHRIGLRPLGLSLWIARYSRMRRLILREPVMVLVEDAARLGDVDRRRRPRPTRAARSAIRDRCAPSNTRRPLPACVRAAPPPSWRASRPRPASSAASIFSAQLGDLLALGVVALAELLLDRLQLLAQQELALAIVDRLLGAVADLARQPQHLEPVRQQSPRRVRAGARSSTVSRISCFSAGVMSMKLAIRSASAGAEVTLCTALTSSAGVCGSSCRTSSAWLRRLSSRASISRALLPRARHRLDARHEKRIAVEKLDDAKAPLALADHMMAAVGAGHIAQQVRLGADAVQIDRHRVVGRRRRAAAPARPGG